MSHDLFIEYWIYDMMRVASFSWHFALTTHFINFNRECNVSNEFFFCSRTLYLTIKYYVPYD